MASDGTYAPLGVLSSGRAAPSRTRAGSGTTGSVRPDERTNPAWRAGLAALVNAELARPPRRLCEITEATDVARSRIAASIAHWLIDEGYAEPIGRNLILATFAGVALAERAGIRSRPIDLNAAARAIATRSAA